MISLEIADYLQSKSLGTVGTDIFYDYLPPSPDTLTVVYDTGGYEGHRKLAYDNPTIQIRTRAIAGPTSVLTAYNRALAIYNELQGLSNVTLSSGTRLINSYGIQSAPTALDKDAENRAEFTINFQLMTRPNISNRE